MQTPIAGNEVEKMKAAKPGLDRFLRDAFGGGLATNVREPLLEAGRLLTLCGAGLARREQSCAAEHGCDDPWASPHRPPPAAPGRLVPIRSRRATS